jgi:hypothetical protein
MVDVHGGVSAEGFAKPLDAFDRAGARRSSRRDVVKRDLETLLLQPYGP